MAAVPFGRAGAGGRRRGGPAPAAVCRAAVSDPPLPGGGGRRPGRGGRYDGVRGRCPGDLPGGRRPAGRGEGSGGPEHGLPHGAGKGPEASGRGRSHHGGGLQARGGMRRRLRRPGRHGGKASGGRRNGPDRPGAAGRAPGRPGECAAEAGKIVKAMEAASFQCSVLARTAYVEAAGAGINGKGFAIVASELRMLASRSAQSAQDAAAFMAEMERTVRESAALASASSREVNGLSAAGDAVCRRAAGAARDAGQAEELKESVRQAACLEEAMEAELARTGRAAQTARQIKARVGKLRDTLGVFRLR